MAKTKTEYVCQECGYRSVKHMGRCPNCGEWNTFIEELLAPANERAASTIAVTRPRRLSEIDEEPWDRIPLPMEEFSRVLGGGIVPGSIVLIGGAPGIGKSTLLLSVTGMIAEHVGPTLYVSGEESVQQIKMRAERLGITSENLYLVTETNVDIIVEHVRQVQPYVLVIDSIQTTYLDGVQSAPGNVSQVKACATAFQRLAKETGLPIFLVGHVTKEGTIAGPRVLEHIVDTVLYLEGDSYHTFRLLRGVKNRFGPTSEVGVFEMRGEGMVEVTNPSEAFLAERMVNAPGSSIVVTMEGTRPLLAEVQALATPTSFANPRRTANGVDGNRLLLLSAVLTRRAGVRLAEQDVFANVIGGLRIDEPAADLAIALAIASSVHDRPVPADMAVVGEIGLSGELRSVGQLAARMNEARKLGFRRVMIPKMVRRHSEPMPEGIDLIAVRSIDEAIDRALR
ncbi:MAG: DNA repair protein RadA [Chloroflexi bacterium]|nr:DNA repair protein RadA [Chloroflexota bacterium]